MRMSDLMACDVYAADGRCLGRVRDVRLVMDGPVRGSLAALRVDALIVGGSAFAGRLGYLRGGVRGPSSFPPSCIASKRGRSPSRPATSPTGTSTTVA